MNRTNKIFTTIAMLLGIGATLLYQRNSALDTAIRKNAELCEQQIAALEKGYQAEIDDLRRYLLEQYNQAPETVTTKETSFNQMISSGHRMRAISSKYEFMLNSALLDAAGKQELRGLLFKWERLTDTARTEKAESGSIPAELQTALDDTESRIDALLTDPYDRETFQRERQRNF